MTAPLEHAGILFFLPADGEYMFHIDIYRAAEFFGEPIEYVPNIDVLCLTVLSKHRTDEMKPEWFPVPLDGSSLSKSLPFDRMWDTDSYWYPMLLSNKFFVGRIDNMGAPGNFVTQKWWFGVSPDANC